MSSQGTLTIREYAVEPGLLAKSRFVLLVRPWSKRRESLVDTPDSSVNTSTIKLEAEINDACGYLDPDSLIAPIAKTLRNPFSQAVIVGRARNSDIVLPSQTVSKVHAYLTLPTGDASVLVKDCNSTNGTFVLIGSGPRKLVEGEALRAVPDTELRFGTVDCLVVESSHLHEILSGARPLPKRR